MSSPKIQIKIIKSILVTSIEGYGKIPQVNKDIDRLYEYIYKHKLEEKIAGSTIVLFYTEFGGKYEVAVPIKKAIPVKGDIKIQALPAIQCMSLIHKGSADNIDHSFSLLKKHQLTNKYQWLFPIREIYNPTDSADYVTEIQVPIK